MKQLRESVLVIGQVLGLLMGDGFTTPLAQTLKQDPYFRFYA